MRAIGSIWTATFRVIGLTSFLRLEIGAAISPIRREVSSGVDRGADRQ
jgi:hypothetical protein